MVTVYTSPACVQCKLTIKQLDALAIAHTVVDVSEDDTARDHVQSLGYRQLPVVEGQDMHWAGFQPERLKQLTA